MELARSELSLQADKLADPRHVGFVPNPDVRLLVVQLVKKRRQKISQRNHRSQIAI
jgi:hypothetical protein